MTHSSAVTTTSGTIQKTLVIENAQHHDTVTVDLQIQVDCICACTCVSKTGSYTNTSYISS